MVIITGLYKHLRDENFEEILEKGGINYFLRKVIKKVSPTVKLELNDGGEYVLTTTTPIKTMLWHIKLGETRTYDTPEGPKKFHFTEEEGKLVQTPVEQGSIAFKVVRTFSDEGMVMDVIHEASGTKAKRFFKKEVS